MVMFYFSYQAFFYEDFFCFLTLILYIHCRIATQGRWDSDNWVTKYSLLFSYNGVTFRRYKQGSRTKVCELRRRSLKYLLSYLYMRGRGLDCQEPVNNTNAPERTRKKNVEKKNYLMKRIQAVKIKLSTQLNYVIFC